MPRGQRHGDRRKNKSAAAMTERAERTAIFGKTKMCKFFIVGVCAKGSECLFAHDPSEMNPAPDLSRTKICKTLINTGFCNEPNCKYAHNKEELRATPVGSADSPDEPRPAGQLDLGSRIAKPVGQTMPALAQPMMGCKPGQGMPPEVLQQLASNMAAVQFSMMHMAMQAQANKVKPDPSSHVPLPLAALTQTEAFTRQHSQGERNGGSNADVAPNASRVQSGFAGGMQDNPDGGGKQGSSGFRPNHGQAAAVGVADALGGSCVPGSAKDQSQSNEQSYVQVRPNNANFVQGGRCAQLLNYDAPKVGGPMPQDSSYPGLLQNQIYSVHQELAPECLQDVLPSDIKLQEKFSSFNSASEIQSPTTASPGMRHVLTWDNDLNSIEDYFPKDLADSGCYQGSTEYRPQMRMAEKRMQDTPICAAGATIMTAETETSHDLATVYEGDVTMGYQGEINPSLDEHPSRQHNLSFSSMGGVTVKNTFLEFPPEQAFVGMRTVQTAAGRLNSLADSWGQEE